MAQIERVAGAIFIAMSLFVGVYGTHDAYTLNQAAEAERARWVVLEVTPTKCEEYVARYPPEGDKRSASSERRARYSYQYEAQGKRHQYVSALAGRCPDKLKPMAISYLPEQPSGALLVEAREARDTSWGKLRSSILIALMGMGLGFWMWHDSAKKPQAEGAP